MNCPWCTLWPDSMLKQDPHTYFNPLSFSSIRLSYPHLNSQAIVAAMLFSIRPAVIFISLFGLHIESPSSAAASFKCWLKSFLSSLTAYQSNGILSSLHGGLPVVRRARVGVERGAISSTVTRSAGLWCASRIERSRPAGPPPMMMTEKKPGLGVMVGGSEDESWRLLE